MGIVAVGIHDCTLHFVRNDQAARGELQRQELGDLLAGLALETLPAPEG